MKKIKLLIMLMLCLVMTSLSHSQNTSKKDRVSVVVINGDTLIQIAKSDAKIILTDLYQKQYYDSIIKEYDKNDSLRNEMITLQYSKIVNLDKLIVNKDLMIRYLNDLVKNKDYELTILNEQNKNLKKEVRKEKILKIGGYTLSAILGTLLIYEKLK